MAVSKKRKKVKAKKRVYLRCQNCGKRNGNGFFQKRFCQSCDDLYSKIKEYARILEAKESI